MAVIGVGHLGKEHARILHGLPQVELVGVVDANAEQAQLIAERLGTRAYTDYRPLLGSIDAATIVVPTVHHHAVATDFLCRGIHVLVEKPLASTAAQADDLVEIARQSGAVLQVGHIERFNPVFEQLARLPLQPKYIHCERLAPYTGRSTDIGVVLDMMIHDIDLVLSLVRSEVVSIDAFGVSVFGGHEDVVDARLHFANGCVASVNASRANPVLVRRMHVWGPEGSATLDFSKRKVNLVQPTTQLRKHGLDPMKLEPAARLRLRDEFFGKYFESVELDCTGGDQLTAELTDFIACVKTGRTPRVTGDAARAAIVLADQILAKVHAHRWNGVADGPTGPKQFPQPSGVLIPALDKREAA